MCTTDFWLLNVAQASIAQTKLLAAELEQKMQLLRLTAEHHHLEHENSLLQEHTSQVEMSEHQRNLRLDALLEVGCSHDEQRVVSVADLIPYRQCRLRTRSSSNSTYQ